MLREFAVHKKFELIRTAHAAPFLKMNNPADDYQLMQFLDMGLGNERNWNQAADIFSHSAFDENMCFVFNFKIFHHHVNAAIHSQDSYVYRVILNLISGIVSSVNCTESIRDQFAMVCSFCLSLMWWPIQVQKSSFFGKACLPNFIHETICFRL